VILNSTEIYNQRHYSLNREITYREVCGEYLIFSGASRQTLIVHPYAYKLIQLLERQSHTYHEILDALGKDCKEFNSDDLASFVSASLEQFLDSGVLDYSGD